MLGRTDAQVGEPAIVFLAVYQHTEDLNARRIDRVDFCELLH